MDRKEVGRNLAQAEGTNLASTFGVLAQLVAGSGDEFEMEEAWDDMNQGWKLPVAKVRAAGKEEVDYMVGRKILGGETD